MDIDLNNWIICARAYGPLDNQGEGFNIVSQGPWVPELGPYTLGGYVALYESTNPAWRLEKVQIRHLPANSLFEKSLAGNYCAAALVYRPSQALPTHVLALIGVSMKDAAQAEELARRLRHEDNHDP